MTAPLPRTTPIKVALVLASMLDVQWEGGVEDALDAARAQGFDVPPLARDLDGCPDVVVVCYPASAHTTAYVRELLVRATENTTAAGVQRVGVAACGYSNEALADADVALLAAAYGPQHTIRVYDPATLTYAVQGWVRAHARQLGASPATTSGDNGGDLAVRPSDVDGGEAECNMMWF